MNKILDNIRKALNEDNSDLRDIYIELQLALLRKNNEPKYLAGNIGD